MFTRTAGSFPVRPSAFLSPEDFTDTRSDSIFRTQCGHILCGGCLKKQFEERLLRAWQALETSTTDFTSNKLRGSPIRLAQHMVDNGLNPRDAFCHPCPTCGLTMDSPPVFSIRMHLLTMAMYGVLGPLGDDETALEGFGERQSFLASFFLLKT